MPIDRYDHYGKPRLQVTEDGTSYLIRDVLQEDGSFAGVCEFATYQEYDGEISWHICREGVEYSEIRPFIAETKIRP